MSKYSPGMLQFIDIKSNFQDHLLFFRMGDFYEFFFEDAVIAARELDITLTSRSSKKGGVEERIPMCGIPYHSIEPYIDLLIGKGYKIAMCEQVEDPKTAKGLVKREVVQIITPGTVMQGKNLDATRNNYLSCINIYSDNKFGFSYIDLTTGESYVTLIDGSFKDVVGEMSGLSIKEVVLSSDFPVDYLEYLKVHTNILISYEDDISINTEFDNILTIFDGSLDHTEVLRDTFGRMLSYLLKTQKRSLDHLQPVIYYELDNYMKLDMYSKRNLELTETLRSQDKKGSLLYVLDATVTAMGGRRLKQWLDRPLISSSLINNRLDMVDSLLNTYFDRQVLKDNLSFIYDLERLCGRVAYGNANAKDLIQLKNSLSYVPDVLSVVSDFNNDSLSLMIKDVDACDSLLNLLEDSISDEPPFSLREGGIIKDGYNTVLDSYRSAITSDKSWISELEKRERIETGIKNLKINYNRAAGYYIEILKSNIHLLPEGRYERKQTLTNAERYITEELKEKERLILEAGDKMVGLEFDLFSEIREEVNTYISKLQHLSKVLSELDVLQSLAEVSERNNYCKPVLSANRKMKISKGRHPVIEKFLDYENYTTNDCLMDDDRELLLITGPNMSGKSTYMRQMALISIMAQIGCYVPCDTAELPVFDRIFTRIGAADDLVSGQSTFMVEMMETQNALTKATNNSLILLDEIGRGTSTYDGMAIAQAIIEYVHDSVGAKTLFSTHYHELIDLEESLPKLKNIRVRVEEEDDKIVFVHKVEEGAANKSYGIHVAELAELPKNLIERAKAILVGLENSFGKVVIEKEYIEIDTVSDKEKDLLLMLKELNVMELSPMDTFNIIKEANTRLNKK